MYFLQLIIISLMSGSFHCALYNDYLEAQFIRDWAAYCVDKHLPSYDAKEISPEIRKCDTERCVFFMYKYISENRPEFFDDFDICFETNTAKRKPNRRPHNNQHYLN